MSGFSAGRKKAPKGQNIGNSDRGTVWSPKFRMSQRRVNRHSVAGSQKNQPGKNITVRNAKTGPRHG